MIGQVNIDSITNKIEILREIVRGKVDVLMTSKRNLESSFPEASLYMESYSKPYWLDRSNKRGGRGIMLYIRKKIPSKLTQPICRKRHTRIPGLWTQELDAGPWTLHSGLWTLDFGLWTLDSGLWTLNAGRWTLDAGRWTLDATLRKLSSGY